MYEEVRKGRGIAGGAHWVLGRTDVFLITVGDIQELSKVLEAAASFELQPADEEMVRLIREERLSPVFT